MTRFDDKLITLSVLRLSEAGTTADELSFAGVRRPERAIADLQGEGATIATRDGRYSLIEEAVAA